MKLKPLGRTNIPVSPLAFGGNVLGWTINGEQSFKVLDAYVEGGGNFIDTADIYCRWATGQGGESETILGNWMRQRKNRNNLVIATKVGMDMGAGKSGLSKKYIIKAADDSLKRLQTDYIDLYQSHKDDENTAIEETLDAYDQLIKAGKVRCIGASNFSLNRLQESLEVSAKYGLPRYQSLQPHYHLLERKQFETELEAFCLKNSLSVNNYFPLASGFLTGKYRNQNDTGKSVRGSSMAKFMNEKGFAVLKGLDELAAKHTCSQAAITLAWYMARPSITAPIASATSLNQLNELLMACYIQLSAGDIELIDTCSRY